MLTGNLKPISNQADFAFVVGVRDADTGDDIDLSTATAITVEIKDRASSLRDYPGSFPYSGRATVLSATLDNGKVTAGDGYYQVEFTRADAQTLCPGTYDVGAVVTINGGTFQSIIGTLAVLDGVVSQ